MLEALMWTMVVVWILAGSFLMLLYWVRTKDWNESLDHELSLMVSNEEIEADLLKQDYSEEEVQEGRKEFQQKMVEQYNLS